MRLSTAALVLSGAPAPYFGMIRNDEASGLPSELHEFLRALASETRQRMIFLMADGRERAVGDVARALNLGVSTASEHLALLRRGGILRSERRGKEVYYRPDREHALELLGRLTEVVTSCCGG